MDEWPLIGRSEELEFVLARLTGDRPGGVVVAGAPGVGKTRLATEAREAADAMGLATARAVASRATASIPFGAMAPLLPRADTPVEDRLDLLRTAAGWLGELAGPSGGGGASGRLVLVVDDAHLLDDGSAALLQQVAAEPWCRLVVTIRSGEPAPDPITALWKDGLADRLELQALSETEAEEFAVSVLASGGAGRRPVAGATMRRLWQASQGNPLYLRELVLGAVAAEALTAEGGLWRLASPLPAPPRLVELVTARLAGIGDDRRRVLEHLAVAEIVGLAMLESISSPEAIEDLERRGLVQVTVDGRRQQVRLAHPLYGEVLRQQLPVVAARRIRRALADAAMAAGAHRREDLLQVAMWHLESGESTDAATLMEAARLAQRHFDNDLAGRLAASARDAGGGLPAGLMLAETYFDLGRSEEVEALLASLEDDAADDEDLAMVVNARAHNLSNYLNRQDDAVAVVESALARMTDEGPRAMLAGRLAVILLFNGLPDRALEAAAPLLQAGDLGARLRAMYVTGIAGAQVGRHTLAAEISAAGYEASLADPEASKQPPDAQCIGGVFAALESGRLADAAALATAGYRALVEHGQREGQATFDMLRGLVGVATGDIAEADRAFREGAVINREIHDTVALRWCIGGTAMAAAMAGDAAAAMAAQGELAGLPDVGVGLMEIDLLGRAEAWTAVARGEISAGRARLLELAGEAMSRSQRSIAIVCLHDAARLGDRSGADRLRALAAQVDGELAGARAEHAEALVKEDPQALDAVAARFETMGALLLAAEAATEAARLYRIGGLARAASAAERRVQVLLARCPGARTPVLAGAVASGDILTAREREIAALAATGLSSKDIAARLVVSARTVDNHLQRVYGKLGITGREALGAALRGD